MSGRQNSPTSQLLDDQRMIQWLREMATEFAAENKTDLKQHICWRAADRLEALIAAPRRDLPFHGETMAALDALTISFTEPTTAGRATARRQAEARMKQSPQESGR